MFHFETWPILAVLAGIIGALWAYRALRNPSLPAPPTNTRLRLRRGAAVYICRVIGQSGKYWRLTPPILKSEVVPLRPSDAFLADYSTAAGVATFFTRIIHRENEEERSILVRAPHKLQVSERRLAERTAFLPGLPATVGEVRNCELRDISARGALINAPSALAAGKEAVLEVDGVSVSGNVLRCEEAGSAVWPGFNLRFIFANRLSSLEMGRLRSLTKEAPAG